MDPKGCGVYLQALIIPDKALPRFPLSTAKKCYDNGDPKWKSGERHQIF